MARQFTRKSSAPSSAYVAVNVVIQVIYVALVVVLATEVFRFHSAAAVTASVLVFAGVFYPLRRRALRAARRRFDHRPAGLDGRSRHSHA